MYLGEVRDAIALAEQAGGRRRRRAGRTRRPRSSTGSPAAATSTSISTALALYTEALAIADRSGCRATASAHILEWRSRCYRRQRD
jgi:hypothetical protein